MSMFHELMMRNKEQIMYATIKGTLTENDGVFSGFSSSNYLLGQTNITSEMQQQYLQSFEFQTKIKISTITQETQILYFPYRGILSGITLRSNGAIRWYVISSNYNIISTSLFTNGDTVYIKGKISNGVATLYSSIDGTNWITEGSVTLGTLEATDVNIPIRLGKSGTSSSIGFEGSIDLNNSYIKIGATKYKLQAVVGYTIVGSPTITDGVASGFSDTNYLNLQQLITEENNLEITIKFTTENDITTGQYPMAWSSVVNGSNRNGGFYISNGKYGIVVRDTTDTNYQRTGTTVSANTTYFGKIIFDFATKNIKVGISTDDVTYNYGIEITLSGNLAPFNRYIRFGRAIPTDYYFSGSIDLNETYIKINNKLWFNGQQA